MEQYQPQYEIGEVVYAASVQNVPTQEKCHDCLGTKCWEVTTPAGELIRIECPTCHFAYCSRGYIEEYNVTGHAQKLTIGQIRGEWGPDGHDFQYMCEETGIGSGQVYRENSLHRTLEIATDLLPDMIDAYKEELDKQKADRTMRKRKDDVGGMTAFYRKEIRDAKKKIKSAQAGLDRIAQDKK